MAPGVGAAAPKIASDDARTKRCVLLRTSLRTNCKPNCRMFGANSLNTGNKETSRSLFSCVSSPSVRDNEVVPDGPPFPLSPSRKVVSCTIESTTCLSPFESFGARLLMNGGRVFPRSKIPTRTTNSLAASLEIASAPLHTSSSTKSLNNSPSSEKKNFKACRLIVLLESGLPLMW